MRLPRSGEHGLGDPGLLFNSAQYVLFLVLVVVLFWNLSGRWRPRFLLLASYAFYAFWDWRFLSLIIASTITDYVVGMYLESEDDHTRRKRALLASLGMNLDLLGVFKYPGFRRLGGLVGGRDEPYVSELESPSRDAEIQTTELDALRSILIAPENEGIETARLWMPTTRDWIAGLAGG